MLFKFNSKLIRLADGMEYYATPVPAQITKKLKTTKAVPIKAKLNSSDYFRASLYPVGGGKHFLRIRNKICKSVSVKENDKIKITFTVVDRKSEIVIPKDLHKALKSINIMAGFKKIPDGQKSFLLRQLDQAKTEPTRIKRIQNIVSISKKRADL